MEGFIGQISDFCFDFAPYDWAFCDGSLLPLNQYTALFSLIGVVYGGDGRTNFALPDLTMRSPCGAGAAAPLTATTSSPPPSVPDRSSATTTRRGGNRAR